MVCYVPVLKINKSSCTLTSLRSTNGVSHVSSVVQNDMMAVVLIWGSTQGHKYDEVFELSQGSVSSLCVACP